MGKTQLSYGAYIMNKHENNKSKKKSGRPSNVQIETSFMDIIRETKLQAINAETELELQMVFFTNQDDKKSRKKQQSLIQDKVKKIFELNSLASEEKLFLFQSFQKYKKNWKFDQIQVEADLPEYFFDDQNDLAFILHQLITNKRDALQNLVSYQNLQKKENAYHKIKAQELFFLCLLCLNSQQNLRDIVLDFFLKNQNLIVNLLKASLEKVQSKYSQKIIKSKQNQKQNDQFDGSRTVKQSDIPYQESIYQHSQSSKIRPQIKKIQKSFKKIIKTNAFDSEQSQEPILTQKQKQQKLILCIVNYISWNYFYVYGEEQKYSKNDQNEQIVQKKEAQVLQ